MANIKSAQAPPTEGQLWNPAWDNHPEPALEPAPTEQAELRERLIYALAELGYARIEEELCLLVFGREQNRHVRRRALPVYVEFLRKNGQDPLDTLGRALKDPAAEVREKAIEICREVKDERIIPHLATCLGDRSLPLQGKAMWAIRSLECQDPLIMEPVLDLVEDRKTPPNTRIRAIQAIGYPQQGNWALPALLNSILDEALPVRIWSGEAFACLGDKEAATSDLLELIGCLQEDGGADPQRLLSLLWALARLGTRQGTRHLEGYLDHPDPDFVRVAVAGLGHSGDKQYQPVLLKMLEENDHATN